MKLGVVPSKVKELFMKEVRDNPDAGMRIHFHNGRIVSNTEVNLLYELEDMSIDINANLRWALTRQGHTFWSRINRGIFNHVFNTNDKGL